MQTGLWATHSELMPNNTCPNLVGLVLERYRKAWIAWGWRGRECGLRTSTATGLLLDGTYPCPTGPISGRGRWAIASRDSNCFLLQ